MDQNKQNNSAKEITEYKLPENVDVDTEKFSKAEIPANLLNTPELIEFAESLGEISENVSEKKETTSSGSIKKTKSKKKLSQEEKIAILIKSNPTISKLQHDIKKHCNKELKVLKKNAKKYKNNVDKAYELSETWRKIKEIYQILASLANSTYESLKKLWLKIIYGITI